MSVVEVGKRGYTFVDKPFWQKDLAVGEGIQQKRIKTYGTIAYYLHKYIGSLLGWKELEKFQLNLDQTIYIAKDSIDKLSNTSVNAAQLQQQLLEWRTNIVQQKGTVWGWNKRKNLPYRIKDEKGVVVERLFRKTSELGRGGYGKVSLLKSGTGALLRYKVLKEARISDRNGAYYANPAKAAVKALQKEWECTKALAGKEGVMTSTKYFKDRNDASKGVMVMAKCQGTMLSIVRNLPKEMRPRAVNQIVKGVLATHEAGYAHRDVKLDNILYRQKKGAWRFELSDFGCVSNLTIKEMRHDVLITAIAAKQILMRTSNHYSDTPISEKQIHHYDIAPELAYAINDALIQGSAKYDLDRDGYTALLEKIADASEEIADDEIDGDDFVEFEDDVDVEDGVHQSSAQV